MIDARSNSYNLVLRKNMPFRVFTCVVTLVAFFVSIFAYDISWAATASTIGTHPDVSPTSPKVKELKAGTFTIPEYLGHVKNSWQPSALSTHDSPLSTTPIVIHIQDAHCNYDAQKRIAEIVGYLNREYGVTSVNLEGGAKEYDLSLFTSISNTKAREKTADYFVKEGLVNGAEYFAINNPGKIALWGVEDPALYMKNLTAYRDSLQHKDAIDKSLRSLSYILANLKIKIYSKELLDFDMKYGAYKANNMEFKDYLLYLLNTYKVIHNSRSPLRVTYGVDNTGHHRDSMGDINQYPNIYLLSQALQEEAVIDFKKANNERDELIDILHNRLSKNDMEKLVTKTVEFKSGRISQRDFYAHLMECVKKLHIDLAGMIELCRFIGYIGLYDSIDKVKINDEINSLEAGIKDAMFENNTQRELAALSKNLALLKNIFNISITRDDYKYYKAHEDEFAMQNFTSFINREDRVIHSSSAPLRVRYDIYDIDQYRAGITRFYEYSFKRDEAFVKNLKFTDRQLPVRRAGTVPTNHGAVPTNHDSRTTNDKPRTSILITGGFHSENLYEMFRKEGISYISIMPNFKNPDGYECPYFNILSGANIAKIKDTLPSVLAASLATPDQNNSILWTKYESIYGTAAKTEAIPDYAKPGHEGAVTGGLDDLKRIYPGIETLLSDCAKRCREKTDTGNGPEVLLIGPGLGFEILDILHDYRYKNFRFKSVGLQNLINSDPEKVITLIQERYFQNEENGRDKAEADYQRLQNFMPHSVENGLPYANDAFDAIIIGRGVMEHIKDRISLVQQVYRVLRPNGLGLVDLRPMVIGDTIEDVKRRSKVFSSPDLSDMADEAIDVRAYLESVLSDEFKIEIVSRIYPVITIHKSAGRGDTIDIPLDRYGQIGGMYVKRAPAIPVPVIRNGSAPSTAGADNVKEDGSIYPSAPHATEYQWKLNGDIESPKARNVAKQINEKLEAIGYPFSSHAITTICSEMIMNAAKAQGSALASELFPGGLDELKSRAKERSLTDDDWKNIKSKIAEGKERTKISISLYVLGDSIKISVRNNMKLTAKLKERITSGLKSNTTELNRIDKDDSWKDGIEDIFGGGIGLAVMNQLAKAEGGIVLPPRFENGWTTVEVEIRKQDGFIPSSSAAPAAPGSWWPEDKYYTRNVAWVYETGFSLAAGLLFWSAFLLIEPTITTLILASLASVFASGLIYWIRHNDIGRRSPKVIWLAAGTGFVSAILGLPDLICPAIRIAAVVALLLWHFRHNRVVDRLYSISWTSVLPDRGRKHEYYERGLLARMVKLAEEGADRDAQDRCMFDIVQFGDAAVADIITGLKEEMARRAPNDYISRKYIQALSLIGTPKAILELINLFAGSRIGRFRAFSFEALASIMPGVAIVYRSMPEEERKKFVSGVEAIYDTDKDGSIKAAVFTVLFGLQAKDNYDVKVDEAISRLIWKEFRGNKLLTYLNNQIKDGKLGEYFEKMPADNNKINDRDRILSLVRAVSGERFNLVVALLLAVMGTKDSLSHLRDQLRGLALEKVGYLYIESIMYRADEMRAMLTDGDISRITESILNIVRESGERNPAFHRWLVFAQNGHAALSRATDDEPGRRLEFYTGPRIDLTDVVMNLRRYTRNNPGVSEAGLMRYMENSIAGLSPESRAAVILGMNRYLYERRRVQGIIELAKNHGFIDAKAGQDIELSFGSQGSRAVNEESFITLLLGFVPRWARVAFKDDIVYIMVDNDSYGRLRYRMSNGITTADDDYSKISRKEKRKYLKSRAFFLPSDEEGVPGVIELGGILGVEGVRMNKMPNILKTGVNIDENVLLHEWFHKFFDAYGGNELKVAMPSTFNKARQLVKEINATDNGAERYAKSIQLGCELAGFGCYHYQVEMFSRIVDGGWIADNGIGRWLNVYWEEIIGPEIGEVLKHISSDRLQRGIARAVTGTVDELLRTSQEGIDQLLKQRISMYKNTRRYGDKKAVKMAEEWVALYLHTMPLGMFKMALEDTLWADFQPSKLSDITISDALKTFGSDNIPDAPAKGILWFVADLVFWAMKALKIEMTQKRKDFVEDFMIAPIEEGLMLLGLFGGVWTYVGIRIAFVLLHAFKSRAPPNEEEWLTPFEKIFFRTLMPVIVSAAALAPLFSAMILLPMPLIASVPAWLPATIALAGIPAHITANRYVTHIRRKVPYTPLQKAVLGGGTAEPEPSPLISYPQSSAPLRVRYGGNSWNELPIQSPIWKAKDGREPREGRKTSEEFYDDYLREKDLINTSSVKGSYRINIHVKNVSTAAASSTGPPAAASNAADIAMPSEPSATAGIVRGEAAAQSEPPPEKPVLSPEQLRELEMSTNCLRTLNIIEKLDRPGLLVSQTGAIVDAIDHGIIADKEELVPHLNRLYRLGQEGQYPCAKILVTAMYKGVIDKNDFNERENLELFFKKLAQPGSWNQFGEALSYAIDKGIISRKAEIDSYLKRLDEGRDQDGYWNAYADILIASIENNIINAEELSPYLRYAAQCPSSSPYAKVIIAAMGKETMYKNDTYWRKELSVALDYFNKPETRGVYAEILITAVNKDAITEESSLGFHLNLLAGLGSWELYAQVVTAAIDKGVIDESWVAERNNIISCINGLYESEKWDLCASLLITAMGKRIVTGEDMISKCMECLDSLYANKLLASYTANLIAAKEKGIMDISDEILKNNITSCLDAIALTEHWDSYAKTLIAAMNAYSIIEEEDVDKYLDKLNRPDILDHYAGVLSRLIHLRAYKPESLKENSDKAGQKRVPLSHWYKIRQMSLSLNIPVAEADNLIDAGEKHLAEIRHTNANISNKDFRIDYEDALYYLGAGLAALQGISPEVASQTISNDLDRKYMPFVLDHMKVYSDLGHSYVVALKDFIRSTGNKYINKPRFILKLAGFAAAFKSLGIDVDEFTTALKGETMREIEIELGKAIINKFASTFNIKINRRYALRLYKRHVNDTWNAGYLGLLIASHHIWGEDDRKLFAVIFRAYLQGNFDAIAGPGIFPERDLDEYAQAGRETILGIRAHNAGERTAAEEAGVNFEKWLDAANFEARDIASKSAGISTGVDLLMQFKDKYNAFSVWFDGWVDKDAGCEGMWETAKRKMGTNWKGIAESDDEAIKSKIKTLSQERNLAALRRLVDSLPGNKPADQLKEAIDNIIKHNASSGMEKEQEREHLKARFWHRDPGSDLFLFSQAGSCKSLGSDALAIFQYLIDAGTHFVVIEDAKKEVKGYARIFLALDKEGQSAIFVDSIDGRIHDCREGIIGYIEDFAASVNIPKDRVHVFEPDVTPGESITQDGARELKPGSASDQISAKIGGAFYGERYLQHAGEAVSEKLRQAAAPTAETGPFLAADIAVPSRSPAGNLPDNDKPWKEAAAGFEKAKENDQQPGWLFEWLEDQGLVSKKDGILEIACGSGQTMMVLINKGYVNILGVDFADGALKMAEEKGIPKGKLKKMDIKSDPIPGKFNWVLANDVLLYLNPQELDVVMKKISDALDEDGILTIRWAAGNDEIIVKNDAAGKPNRWLFLASKDYIDNLAKRHGLEVLLIELKTEPIFGGNATCDYWYLVGRKAFTRASIPAVMHPSEQATKSDAYIGVLEVKGAVGKLTASMAGLSGGLSSALAAANAGPVGLAAIQPVVSAMSMSDNEIGRLKEEIMRVVQSRIGPAASAWLAAENRDNNTRGFVLNLSDYLAGSDTGKLMDDILAALRLLAKRTGKWQVAGTLVKELDALPAAGAIERHRVYVQTQGTEEVVLEERDDCIVIGIFTKTGAPIFSVTILKRAGKEKEREEKAAPPVPPQAGSSIDSEEIRKDALKSGLADASERSKVVKVVAGITDSGDIGTVNELSEMLARGGFSILESDKAKMFKKGDTKQIVPFVIVPGDAEKTQQNYENAMKKALTEAGTDGYVVSFAPQMVNGPRLAGLYKSGPMSIIIPDAYSDIEDGYKPDIMARFTLARDMVADRMGLEAWSVIEALLKRITDNDLEGVSSLEGLLEKLNKHALRVKRVNVNKDIAEWKRVQKEISSAA